jgi:hypothetical protein
MTRAMLLSNVVINAEKTAARRSDGATTAAGTAGESVKGRA